MLKKITAILLAAIIVTCTLSQPVEAATKTTKTTKTTTTTTTDGKTTTTTTTTTTKTVTTTDNTKPKQTKTKNKTNKSKTEKTKSAKNTLQKSTDKALKSVKAYAARKGWKTTTKITKKTTKKLYTNVHFESSKYYLDVTIRTFKAKDGKIYSEWWFKKKADGKWYKTNAELIKGTLAK